MEKNPIIINQDSEADTCRKEVTPKLYNADWSDEQIFRNMSKSKINEIAIYETEDGQVKVGVLFEQDNLWLTQKLMAELFD